MKYILDTDHLTLLERAGTEGTRIRAKLLTLSSSDYATTIISYEEQFRGWLSRLSQARTIDRVVAAYANLSDHLEVFTGIAVLRFDESAAFEFEKMRFLRTRIGTQDLRIAAIAAANNVTLLSRNLVDFGKIPGLRVEDWSL